MTIDSRATGCRSEGLWGGRKPGLWLASMARYLEHKHGNAPRQIRRKARERSQRVQVLGLRQPQTQKRAEATALARLMAVSVDLDLRRFGLGLLLDRHLEHAVLVAGLDLVVARVVGQLERPANRSIAPLRHVDLGLVGPFGPLALRCDQRPFSTRASIDSFVSPGISK